MSINRRNFLKALGLGSGVSAVSACGLDDNRYYTPVEQILPYVIRPEAVTPGTNTHFATTLLTGPHASPVLAVHRDGRVTNLGANRRTFFAPAVPTDAFFELQRSYSPDRLTEQKDGWEASLEALAGAVKAARAGGKKVAWLGKYRSGTLPKLIAGFTGGNAVFWEPMGRAAEAAAAEELFGTRQLPKYDLGDAHYVLSFGADFLGTWGGPETSAQYGKARDANHGHTVARFAHVGPYRDQTAANADDWHKAKAGSQAVVAMCIAKLVADKASRNSTAKKLLVGAPDAAAAAAASGLQVAEIEAMAAHFSKGHAVALPGGVAGASAAEVELAKAVMLLNTVSASPHFKTNGYAGQVDGYAELSKLMADMKAGKIGVLFIDDVNPVFALPAAAGFSEALAGVGTTVALSGHMDETVAACSMQLAVSDTLEDWGDEEVTQGVHLFRQPAMQPRGDTRSIGDILLATWRAVDPEGAPKGTWLEYFKAAWLAAAPSFLSFWKRTGGYRGKVSQAEVLAWMASKAPAEETDLAEGDEPAAPVAAEDGEPAEAQEPEFSDTDLLRWWESALNEGYFQTPDARLLGEPKVVGGALNVAAATLAGSGEFALHIFKHHFLGDGRYANQPWAQEMPDPMTGQVWGTWAVVHPDAAKRLGVVDNDLIRIQTDHGTLELGVEVSDSVRLDTIAVPFGNGHTKNGRYANGIGTHVGTALAAVTGTGGELAWQQARASVTKAGKKGELVSTFGHDHDMDRHWATTVSAETFAKHADEEVAHPGEFTGIHILPMDKRLQEKGIEGFYPVPDHPTYRFAMTIDTNRCNGCGACAVACYAENNLAVVGKRKVREGRESGWLRVNRYIKGSTVSFVPMMCQQCGHAPCESVCPVLATYHTIDGLNAMIYNRCVGTRYCSNACPYSARRFNYHTYKWPEPFNLLLNPDVTTREMGVMEKCTFCVQRIRRAKDSYRDRGFDRTVPAGVLRQLTACADACPAQAITFGNLNDPKSVPAKTRKSGRNYFPIADINVHPGVNYLAQASFNMPEKGHVGGHGDGEAADHGDGSNDKHNDAPAHGAGH
jgi:Fe-S-cluster-containing dehydrogenase component/anaerobic selenocysteine-containing dehydrogenase